MNKIFKVIYSKTRHCYVVVSELAKSHCKTTQSHTARSKTALTAAVLLALGAFSFVGMPSVKADGSLYRNDYVGTNYTKDNGKSYGSDETKNYHGAGAQGVGSNTLGMNAIAGKNTITIGDRNASAATESVYIGAKYDAKNQVYPSSGHNVVSVGYGSDAAGTGSIAIGSGAAADPFDNAGEGKNPDKESQSIAIGYMATAKQNNIALGAGSIATEKASTAAALYTGQAAPTSYVSVGSTVTKNGENTSTLRRITNVADGAADTDVATIAQLNKVAAEKGTWKLTAGSTNSTMVDATNNTVDFSAAKDSKNGSEEYSNLTVSKGEKDNNVTIGLKKDVILGQAVSGEGGS
ncbi:ESPR-type extended signal peptide-containing protein [Megasphaera sp.]|uniref:ESPR domain-containing protein n=1 Tax=Megasphaera sp. TaxID=2023260 RepID=UPI00352266CD